MDDLQRVVVTIVALVGAGVFSYAAIAALNVWTRRMERKDTPGQEQLDALHTRLAATESLEGRIEELEQRVDFAERLIAQQRETERLPAGQSPDRR
jgi:hypothetical protein